MENSIISRTQLYVSIPRDFAKSNGVTPSRLSVNSLDPPAHPSRPWSVFDSVVNLPAVLNDPVNRPIDIFARTWGDLFEHAEVAPSPHLPAIDETQFEHYLTKVGSRAASIPTSRSPSQNVLLQAVRSAGVDRDFPTTNTPTSQSVPQFQLSSNLDSVPSVVFDAEFNLQNLRTFTQLIPLHPRRLAEVASNTVSFDPASCDLSPSRRNTREQQLSDFRSQHDRLAHYLDIVEVHLAEQVSRKSSIFFEAVCCHDIVREQLVEALSQVKLVREKLQEVDSTSTIPILRLHRLIRRKTNCEILLQRLKMIASLQSAQPTIQLLLRTSDFCAALDLVASTQDLLRSSGKDAQENQLVCLRHLSAQLTEISRFVRHMIEAEFEAALRHFLEIRSDQDQYTGPDLVSCLLGLLHTKRHDFVSAFRAELIAQAKRVQSMSGPEVDASTGRQSEPISLKEHLRTMPTTSWLELVNARCNALSALLTRAEKAKAIFLETISRCTETTSPTQETLPIALTTQEVDDLTSQLHTALQVSKDICQKIIHDFVLFRMKYTFADNQSTSSSAEDRFVENLDVNEFVRLLQTLSDFQEFTVSSTCTSCPPYGSKSNDQTSLEPSRSTPLLRLLIALIRLKLNRLHSDRMSKLEMMLNQERWQVVPVPKQLQQLVNNTFGVQLREGCKTEFTSARWSSLDDATDMHQIKGGVSSTLVIGKQHFVVVGTALLLLPILLDYVTFAEQMPGRPHSINEVTIRLDELLKSFNSRTCKLVLGAEARRAADLPTISARTLALASRSVQLIAHIIPVIQSRFDSWCGLSTTNDPASRRYSLHHVLNLLHEHVDQLHDKLFNLLSNRIQDRLSVWEIKPPTPSAEFRTICHSLIRMTSMIKDVLPGDQLVKIMLRAHNEFKAHMRHRLRTLSVIADGGPQQSLVDAELTFYLNRFRELTPQFSDFLDDFADIWSS